MRMGGHHNGMTAFYAVAAKTKAENENLSNLWPGAPMPHATRYVCDGQGVRDERDQDKREAQSTPLFTEILDAQEEGMGYGHAMRMRDRQGRITSAGSSLPPGNKDRLRRKV